MHHSHGIVAQPPALAVVEGLGHRLLLRHESLQDGPWCNRAVFGLPKECQKPHVIHTGTVPCERAMCAMTPHS